MPTSSVPPVQFTPTGLVLPTEDSILAGVQADMNAAFGGGLNLTNLQTPQGQLASSQAAIIADKNGQIAQVLNNVNPAFATGRWQDALGAIYFQERLPAQSTVVQCVCTGLAGVVIPVGATAVDTSGNKYSCTLAGTIPISGSITLPFAALVTGPLVCAANTLNAIYQVIPGWNTINNPSGGVVGNNVETAQAFEARRRASVALNSVNSIQSIKAAVLAVPNVLDCYVLDNSTNAPVTTGGVTIAANSVYVAVLGGLASDVAKAIWSKKSLGCSYTGTTTVVVYDTTYAAPQPAYNVTFTIPSSLPIYMAVSIANNPGLPSNLTQLVQNAVVNAFAGLDGGPRAKIGTTVYSARFYPPVTAVDPNVEILSLFVGTAPSPTGAQVGVNLNQVPTITAANITVTLV